MANVDLSGIVAGHRDYATKIDEILEFLGYGVQELDGPIQLRRTHSAHNIREKTTPLVRATSEDSFFLLKTPVNHPDLIQKSGT